MKIKLLFLITVLSLTSCRNTAQQANFDFSSRKEFRETKSKGILVNDYDGIFSRQQKLELFQLLKNYSDSTSRQMVVVTISDISPYTNNQKFAVDLGNYWGVGDAEKDNGLIIVLNQTEREIAIATGNGTGKVLTDEICQNVIDEVMVPRFKEDRYYEGIKDGLASLISIWD